MGAKVEAICGWDGSNPIPLRQYAKILDASLVIGERYLTTFEPLSSIKSRSHYFATIADIFSSWPESHPRQFDTPDHMRYWALIRCGFRKERLFSAANKAEAGRLAAFLRRDDDQYVEAAVHDNVVVEWTALSQKTHAMGREQFGRSKTEVLAFLAGEVGVTVESLAPPREEPPMRESER